MNDTFDIRNMESHIEVHKFRGGAIVGATALALIFQAFVPVYFPQASLLDLPLLNKSYEQWSAESLALSRQGPRAELAAAFQAHLAPLDPGAPENEQSTLIAARLFTDYLRACRDDRKNSRSLHRFGEKVRRKRSRQRERAHRHGIGDVAAQLLEEPPDGDAHHQSPDRGGYERCCRPSNRERSHRRGGDSHAEGHEGGGT